MSLDNMKMSRVKLAILLVIPYCPPTGRLGNCRLGRRFGCGTSEGL